MMIEIEFTKDQIDLLEDGNVYWDSLNTYYFRIHDIILKRDGIYYTVSNINDLDYNVKSFYIRLLVTRLGKFSSFLIQKELKSLET